MAAQIKIRAIVYNKLDIVEILIGNRWFMQYAQLPNGFWVEAGLGTIPARQFKTADAAAKAGVERAVAAVKKQNAEEAEIVRKVMAPFIKGDVKCISDLF